MNNTFIFAGPITTFAMLFFRRRLRIQAAQPSQSAVNSSSAQRDARARRALKRGWDRGRAAGCNRDRPQEYLPTWREEAEVRVRTGRADQARGRALGSPIRDARASRTA